MSTLVRSGQPSALAVFRNRAFTLLWSAQLISVAGSALSSLAAAILVYRMTGSALSVGLVLIAAAVPGLLVGLVAGVFVDRFDRKRVMIAADLVRAALIGAIPLLLPFGVVWLYVMVVLASAAGQFFDPAHSSVLPEVASDEELAAANSLMAISSSGSWAIGFAAAGLIASQASIDWAFYLDALSFLISAACVLRVRVASHEAADATNVATVLRDLREGAHVLVTSPILRSLFLAFVPVFLCFGLTNSLLLPFALRALHATELQYSLLEGICSVGFVAGSLLMARLADRLHEGQWIALSLLGIGLTFGAFALSSALPLAMPVLLISGVLNAPSAIGRQLVIQRNTPAKARGRVFSAFFVTRDVMVSIGMAAAGLADLVDVRVLFLAGAAVLFLTGALVLVLPGLRQSAAEWRHAARLLRGAHNALGLGRGRAATLADFESLVMHLHALAGLSDADRVAVVAQSRVYEVAEGTVIMRHGEAGDAAFFLLAGRAVAGRESHGAYRSLSILSAGDFFGEIGALTGAARSATVMAQEPAKVLQLGAEALRRMMTNPLVSAIFLQRMAERVARANAASSSYLASSDQQSVHGHVAASSSAPLLAADRLSPYATHVLRGSSEAYATRIMQYQEI
jgi:CRP-like cAMP-binding protein/Na+/melibiose symporter-like transporter